MAAWKLGAALATGCTIILKAAEQTPLSALYLAELSAEVGIREGVFNIVNGSGATGEEIVNHPLVNKVAFTGSTDVGKHIMSQASGNLKRVTLELGGKSPNIILPDADLSRAIPAAMSGIMMNQGEVCSDGVRLFVQKKSFDNVMADLVFHSKSIRKGAGMEKDNQLLPLRSKEQQ